MQTVVILIHLMIVLAMVGLVLIQKSEGGGLGMGGGGGGGFMSNRGTANVLTRATGDPGGAVLRHQPVPVDPGELRPQAALDPRRRRHARPRPERRRCREPDGGVLDQLGGGTPQPAPAAPAAPSGPQVPRQ